MIELQNWSKVSSGTWKANTIKGASTYTETTLRSFWHWKMKSMLTWMILPFLHNQCIEIANTASRFFFCMALDISFLVLFPVLATNLNSAVFTTLTHGTLGWRPTSSIKYLTFYPSSFLGWYLFVNEVVRGGEEGGKVWHYRKLEKAVTEPQHDFFTPLQSVPQELSERLLGGPMNQQTGCSISLAPSIFLYASS